MAQTKVEVRALLSAVTEPASDVLWYLDSHDGRALKISRSTPQAELARFKGQHERDAERFLKIPRPTSEETYSDMVAFQATVKDKKLQERLRLELSGGGTLRNFLDVLQPCAAEKQRWYNFRESRLTERIRGWLRENGLSAL